MVAYSVKPPSISRSIPDGGSIEGDRLGAAFTYPSKKALLNGRVK